MCGPSPSERRVRPRKEPRGEVERDALEVVPQQAAQPDVHAGHERQRRQEVLAELAVWRPTVRPARVRSKERESMSTGRPRRNWML